MDGSLYGKGVYTPKLSIVPLGCGLSLLSASTLRQIEATLAVNQHTDWSFNVKFLGGVLWCPEKGAFILQLAQQCE